MRKRIRKYIISVLVFIILLGIKSISQATGMFLEDNKNSIVQVVMVYPVENGERFILQSGSGIVINSNTVLTNYHLVHMSSKNQKKAKKYVLNNSDITEFSAEQGMRIAIVKEDDVLIYAEIAQESKEKDFAILTLSEETNRSQAVFGNSDITVMAEDVIAIGYPSIKPFNKKEKKIFHIEDINLISGTVSEVESQHIKVSGKISAGNSGGALINKETGEVIGLLTYSADDTKKECFKAIPINQIKIPYLEGTAYKDNSVAVKEEVTTEATTEATTEVQVDKTTLSESIEKAMKLDQSVYESDSYMILVSCLQQAQKVQYNEQATQAEVDDAQKILQQSIDNLKVIEKTNWVVITGIVIAVILAIAIITMLIIMAIKINRQKKEKNQFTVLTDNEIPNFSKPDIQPGEVRKAVPTQENVDQETTLLNVAGIDTNKNNDSTTVLNVAPPQINAYLHRKKTGERKQIDSVEFTVGKDETRVNYFVSDNKAISRCHMKIIKKGISYYVMDLGSTNYTYLNGERLQANKEEQIKNGDNIKIADEEFTIEII